MKILRIYFSFRSPYAWLGCYRFQSIVADLGIEYALVPVSPPKKTVEKIMPDPEKLVYVIRDVKRFASAYGLEYGRPDPFDCDWFIPHSAFLAADDAGKGLEFANQMFRMRFCENRDISGEEVIFSASSLCGLDPENILAATTDKNYRRRLLKILSGLDAEHIFGVPTFVYGKEKFWGNDRLEWCIREINRDAGKSVPDLKSDLLARPI